MAISERSERAEASIAHGPRRVVLADRFAHHRSDRLPDANDGHEPDPDILPGHIGRREFNSAEPADELRAEDRPHGYFTQPLQTLR